MKRFEYKVIDFKGIAGQSLLNPLGSEGYELVSVNPLETEDGGRIFYTFKRELP